MTLHVLTVSNIWNDEQETFTGDCYEACYYAATEYIHETLERIKNEYANDETVDVDQIDEENDIVIKHDTEDAYEYFYIED